VSFIMYRKRFCEPGCAVLMLNVKNGAEGLTLVGRSWSGSKLLISRALLICFFFTSSEATHVFMIEPILNAGLDSQGTHGNFDKKEKRASQN
jgi:hypothetical protein